MAIVRVESATRSQRVYFVDNGIRHHLVGDFRPLRERGDAGPALENWVFTEIWKALPPGAEPRFWRTTSQAEVDFVVETGGALVAVEAKATDLGRPALGRSARSFIEAYAPRELLVVNRGVDTRQDVGRTTVRWIRPEHLASSLDLALR